MTITRSQRHATPRSPKAGRKRAQSAASIKSPGKASKKARRTAQPVQDTDQDDPADSGDAGSPVEQKTKVRGARRERRYAPPPFHFGLLLYPTSRTSTRSTRATDVTPASSSVHKEPTRYVHPSPALARLLKDACPFGPPSCDPEHNPLSPDHNPHLPSATHPQPGTMPLTWNQHAPPSVQRRSRPSPGTAPPPVFALDTCAHNRTTPPTCNSTANTWNQHAPFTQCRSHHHRPSLGTAPPPALRTEHLPPQLNHAARPQFNRLTRTSTTTHLKPTCPISAITTTLHLEPCRHLPSR